jgi:U3 small nucleolar RNA-associated protein 20
MFLSTVVTKIILKFPIDIFVVELQKILSKICKLLKKREVEVRDNARKCLVEICRLIGTDMLYLVFRELKFHLRDNFQNHIMNYTIYYIL